MPAKKKTTPRPVTNSVHLRIKPANSWLESVSWLLGELDRRYKACAEQEEQWIDIPSALAQFTWNKPTMEVGGSVELTVEVNAELSERFLEAVSSLPCTQAHLVSEIEVLDSQIRSGKQEIVAYDFGRGQHVCHWCVYVDMGLQQYTAHSAELLKRAMWDSDERIPRLICSRCRHPLVAIVFGKRQSLPYKDPAAFVQQQGICYISLPTRFRDARRYRYDDFLKLAGGAQQAAALFEHTTSEDPLDVLGGLSLEEGSAPSSEDRREKESQ